MIMDRPLIVAPAVPRVREIAWWPTMGGGTYACSAEEFQIQLTKLVSDRDYRAQQLDEQRKFLAKSFANRGYATERTVDLLERYSANRTGSNVQPHDVVRTTEMLLLPNHAVNSQF